MRRFPRTMRADPKSQIDNACNQGRKFTCRGSGIGLFRQPDARRNIRCYFWMCARVRRVQLLYHKQESFPGFSGEVRRTASVAGVRMQASMFNVRVPLDDRNEVFLMNTFTDAQLIVSRDVVDLLDRRRGLRAGAPTTSARRSTQLAENGFVVTDRATERDDLQDLLPRGARGHRHAEGHGADDAAVQLRVRLLHPGRPRRLQQDRREDVDGDGGAARRLDGVAARRDRARSG